MNQLNLVQIKHQLRGALVEIGIKAVKHALRFEPDNRLDIERGLKAIENHEPFEGAVEVDVDLSERRGCVVHKYSKDNLLMKVTNELSLLSRTEAYLSGAALKPILRKCWDAGSFDRPLGISDEQAWQHKNIDPEVERAFARMRDAQKQLKENKSCSAK